MSQVNILVTGGAGFIGSHLVDALLADDRVGQVRVLDDLSTGKRENLAHVMQNPKLTFIEGDICEMDTCMEAMEGVTMVSHQAALGSVPRSIQKPLKTNEVNIGGTLNVFTAARELGIRRVVYAASSSTYGDSTALPKREGEEGKPLSPYAVTKLVNELYADVYAKLYGMELIGLRYFNVFGPRQDPAGPYAAVIPLFIKAILSGNPPTIHGDGMQSRDFTYVANAVHANLQALFTENETALNQVYNIAVGDQTSLLGLFEKIKKQAQKDLDPIHGPTRTGDVRHSLADITKAQTFLGYTPPVDIDKGLALAYDWYANAQVFQS